MNLLAISGSLRANSPHTALLQTAALLVPDGVTMTFYNGLAELPYFNPDLDNEPGPIAVGTFRAELRAANAVVICSPEYAQGVPGSLKNALDWVVSSGELVNKPVALINVSPRAAHAYECLVATLESMNAIVVPEASIMLSAPGTRMPDPVQMAADPEIAPVLRAAIIALAQAALIRLVDRDRPVTKA